MWQNEKNAFKKKTYIKFEESLLNISSEMFIFFMFSKKSKEELLPGIQDSVGWQKFTDLPVERGVFYETSVNILKVRTLLPFEMLINFNHVWWPSSQSKHKVQDRKTTISVALLRV